MKIMKYGFINTTGFNKGIKKVNKDSNFADIKDNLQKATKRAIEILSNKR